MAVAGVFHPALSGPGFLGQGYKYPLSHCTKAGGYGMLPEVNCRSLRNLDLDTASFSPQKLQFEWPWVQLRPLAMDHFQGEMVGIEFFTWNFLWLFTVGLDQEWFVSLLGSW